MMTKAAGTFSGVVTQAAPADNAVTEKQRGYTWMEYGTSVPPPVTLCNEVWDIATLAPDVWVAGMDAGVWNKDMITGTGDVRDDKSGDPSYQPDDTGGYTYYENYAPATRTGLPAYYLTDCQWFAFSGPENRNRIASSTYADFDLFGAMVEDNSEAGLDGIVGSSSILIDNDPTDSAYATKDSALGTMDNINGVQIVGRALIEKDLAAQNWSLLMFTAGSSTWKTQIFAIFSQATGAIRYQSGDGLDYSVKSIDSGDYWDFFIQMDSPVGGSGTLAGSIGLLPAFNLDGSDTHVRSLTGYSVKTVYVGIHSEQGDDVPMNTILRTGVLPLPAPDIDQSIVYVEPSNHQQASGGYYIEWRPQDAQGTMEILSLNDAPGLLYWQNGTLYATDGTNTASVPLSVVNDTKYRLGVVWGDSLRVGVDTIWGTAQPYDGTFPVTGNLSIFRNPLSVNLFREFRGFHTTYTVAITEIQTLMAGEVVVF